MKCLSVTESEVTSYILKRDVDSVLFFFGQNFKHDWNINLTEI